MDAVFHNVLLHKFPNTASCACIKMQNVARCHGLVAKVLAWNMPGSHLGAASKL